jgi:hypothetical protein
VCVTVRAFVRVYVHVYVHVYVYVCVCVRVCACAYACVCVRVYVCAPVRMRVHVRVSAASPFACLLRPLCVQVDLSSVRAHVISLLLESVYFFRDLTKQQQDDLSFCMDILYLPKDSFVFEEDEARSPNRPEPHST